MFLFFNVYLFRWASKRFNVTLNLSENCNVAEAFATILEYLQLDQLVVTYSIAHLAHVVASWKEWS